MMLIPTIVLFLAASVCAQQEPEEKDDTIVLKPPATAYEPTTRPDLDKTAKRIIALTNELRRAKKLPKVDVGSELSKASEEFAGYMARTHRYGHGADGRHAEERVEEQKYDPCIIGENLAYTFRSRGFTTEQLAKKLVEAWKNSPEHLKNLLDPDVTEIGVALQVDDHGYFYAVQLVGRPKSQSFELELANESEAPFEYELGGKTLELRPRQTRTHWACRLKDLEFKWRDGEEQRTVRPKDGDRFVVTRDGDSIRLEPKEEPR